jgi:hypothetical protein
VLLLQGLDDPIVPPSQAKSIADDLAKHGIQHALLTFKGESHGFRRAETIVAALEAELSFYGQVLGFSPPGIAQLPLDDGSAGGDGAGRGRGRGQGRGWGSAASRKAAGAGAKPGAADMSGSGAGAGPAQAGGAKTGAGAAQPDAAGSSSQPRAAAS